MHSPALPQPPQLSWTQNGADHHADWRSESGAPPPRRVVVADDTMNADTAYRLACEGSALLWRGDFQNARQLLQALTRRIDRRPASKKRPADFPEAFHLHRQARAQRARALGMLLIPFEPGHVIPLRRAPDVARACRAVHGEAERPYVASLRELLGLVGAWQWREKGVEIAALGARVYPHYGVYSPVRGEYLDLIAQAPLPRPAGVDLAFDIGTGTGVIAALLARRGVRQVVATDMDPRALACAEENLERLGLRDRVRLERADLFPSGQAQLVVCNPPWVPARASAPVEYAVYDPESRMLRGFLQGLAGHLADDGEGWLILSDLAEHLRLRTREELLQWIEAAGLAVAGRLDTRPVHGKASDPDDPLHAARVREVTSLWRLRRRAATA
ncbi:methylase [Bordetella genomosp. 8]|uniref:Methylase n=1 Tax=Bordetella genomosp. 8 TaxID=1416806 RepID=A0A1W6YRX1_9BORD|nr:class I SAM-dependent methyltransferase [Bordetella genomosp. 8]ARP83363.1 methylase [Bordetella genomosp. 8]